MAGDKGFTEFKEGQDTFGNRHKGWAPVSGTYGGFNKKMVQNHLRATMYML